MSDYCTLHLPKSRYSLDNFRTSNRPTPRPVPKPPVCPSCGHSMSFWQKERAEVCMACEDREIDAENAPVMVRDAAEVRRVIAKNRSRIVADFKSGDSQRDIAQRYGIPRATIQGVLHREGLRNYRRNTHPQELIDRVLELRRTTDLTKPEIAAEMNLTWHQVNGIIERARNAGADLPKHLPGKPKRTKQAIRG